MTRKSVTAAIPATGAGVTSPRTVIATPDDSVIRTVRAVKSSLTTKGMRLHFDSNSQDQVVVDAAILAQYANTFDVSYQVGVNIQLSFSVENTTGGALNAGDFVTMVYEV